MNATLSTILLSRDLDGLLRVCLQHLDAAALRAGFTAETLVVDNASRHPCPPAFEGAPAHRLIRFDQHQGFGAACNRAAERAEGAFLLFLNNDVLLDPDALAGIRRAFQEHAALAACGALGHRGHRGRHAERGRHRRRGARGGRAGAPGGNPSAGRPPA